MELNLKDLLALYYNKKKHSNAESFASSLNLSGLELLAL